MARVIASAQMSRTEWLERLTQCCQFDPRKMFDAQGRPKKLAELDDNEAAAIAVFEVSETVHGHDFVKRTFRVRFLDRLSALALMGKACHWYADRQEQTERDGVPIPRNLTVQFVDAALSPEEAYRRMVTRPA